MRDSVRTRASSRAGRGVQSNTRAIDGSQIILSTKEFRSNHDRSLRPKRYMGRTEDVWPERITSEPTVGKGNTIYESEMALFFECIQ